MKKLLAISAVLFSCSVQAQYQQYANFWNNPSANNPAWISLEGRVNVSNITQSDAELNFYTANQLTSSFRLPKRFGYVGISNDFTYTGYNFFVASLEHSSKLRYSYVWDLKNASKLSLGAELGMSGRSTKQVGDWANNCTVCDPAVFEPIRFVKPTFTVGTAYTIKQITVGVSINQFTFQNRFNGNTTFENLYKFESQASYAYKLNDKWTFSPMLRYINIDNFQTFGGLVKTEFMNKFWASAQFSTNDVGGLSIGAILADKFSIGYGYSIPISRLANGLSGDFHELTLRYQLK